MTGGRRTVAKNALYLIFDVRPKTTFFANVVSLFKIMFKDFGFE